MHCIPSNIHVVHTHVLKPCCTATRWTCQANIFPCHVNPHFSVRGQVVCKSDGTTYSNGAHNVYLDAVSSLNNLDYLCPVKNDDLKRRRKVKQRRTHANAFYHSRRYESMSAQMYDAIPTGSPLAPTRKLTFRQPGDKHFRTSTFYAHV